MNAQGSHIFVMQKGYNKREQGKTMNENKRKFTRFSATAFLNMPIVLDPLPPFFGDKVKGRLIDMSAGGMSLIISELIPLKSKLHLVMRFPDKTTMKCNIEVRHAQPRDRDFLHGFKFLNLPYYIGNKIDTMSNDYIDCETRIQKKESEICISKCTFYNMCTKSQRKEPVLFDVDMALELAFKTLADSPIKNR